MQKTPVGSKEVKLEWLGNPVSPVVEALRNLEVLVGSCTPILDSLVADNPYQPSAVTVSSVAQVAEPSQTRVRPRSEIRGPSWLKGYVRTAVY